MTTGKSTQEAVPPPAKSRPTPKKAGTGKWKLKALAAGVAAAALLGGGIWFGSTLPDPTASDAYVQLAQGKAGVEADFAELQGNYETLQQEHSTLRMGIEDREAAAGAREEAVAADEKKSAATAAALKKREEAVTGAEAKKAKNTVSDGTWTVGRDIEPGTYLANSDVASSCYWGIYTSGSNGSDIIENDIPGGGRPSVALSAGQDFKSSRCGSWSRQ